MSMARRYLVAQALGKDNLAEAVREDGKLLNSYGLKLLSVEGGVQAALMSEVRGSKVHPWNVISINNKTWEWLRPILAAEASESLAAK